MRAQELERKRIAQELHDGIGQRLSVIKYSLEGYLASSAEESDDVERGELQGAVEQIKGILEEVRRIARNLTPTTLDEMGLVKTIRSVCAEFQAAHSGTAVSVNIDVSDDSIPEVLKLALYRSLQEALNNIAKHAQATRVFVDLMTSQQGITLRVEDNGSGFDLKSLAGKACTKPGFGLQSMRERAEMTGGSFKVDSEIGRGTTIELQWSQPEILLLRDEPV